MPILIMDLVLIVFVVALGVLFASVSAPGKRLIPGTIIVAALAAAYLVFRVAPPVAILIALGGTGLGFLVAAVTSRGSSSSASKDRRNER